jgi:predicted dehydrogenase
VNELLKIGILGASRIVPWALAEPVLRRTDVELVAIAAGREGAAAELAKKYDITHVYSSYADVLADPSVNMIYNPLPPYLHAEWSIKALDAGKHVLCEKPFAMDASQARQMNAAALRNNRRIIEAFHDRYHPVFLHILEIVNGGKLGTISKVRAVFNHTIPHIEGEFRRIRKMGGGALMDLGCYPVHWTRSLLGEEPRVVEAKALKSDEGYDEEMTAFLIFESGVEAEIECKMSPGWQYHARFEIIGSRGSLTAENSLLPHLGHSILTEIDGRFRQYTLGGQTTFDHQLEAIVKSLSDGTQLPTEGNDPIGNMATIDAIYERAGFIR